MLEFPEVFTMTQQLREHVVGLKVKRVLPPAKEHKFCWYQGDPAGYDAAIKGCEITGADGFGIYVELGFDNGMKLCFNDGVNARLIRAQDAPKAYQLMIELQDESALVFTVAMYGGIILHDGGYDNEYYLKSQQAISPIEASFPAYFEQTFEQSKPTLSAKAFLATEQRFAGIGNGVLQDILFQAGIHPKQKIGSLTQGKKQGLLAATVDVLKQMAAQGGRDTEKDLFGKPGGYRTLLSKNTVAQGCPRCHGAITKEAYLGGSVYYCATCQPVPLKSKSSPIFSA